MRETRGDRHYEILIEDIRRIREQVASEIFGRRDPGQLLEVLRSSDALFFHVKYVYDIVNPSLARVFIRLGRVNAWRKRSRRGARAELRGIIHSQNAGGFVCGLSQRKTFLRRAQSKKSRCRDTRSTEADAVVAPEVERIDVLVLFRRILGVLDGSVRPE